MAPSLMWVPAVGLTPGGTDPKVGRPMGSPTRDHPRCGSLEQDRPQGGTDPKRWRPAGGSVLDEVTVTVFPGPEPGAFGHSVAQFDAGRVLVGAPLEPGRANETGRVYRCQLGSGSCQSIPIANPPDATSMSLGLSVAAHGSRLLACGPTAQRACGENMEVRGYCFWLATSETLPAALPECPLRASDIVFLVDGSGSVAPDDFERMKTFIIEVMSRFQGSDSRFALVQFSHSSVIHFDFAAYGRFSRRRWEREVRGVQQLGESTRTASGIRRVVRELFGAGHGARRGTRRILIVVTDGQKYGDNLNYADVIPEADRAGVVRYAIGVGSAFSQRNAVAELHAIASAPAEEHVFRVDNFNALQGIQRQLEEKIFAIEGTQSSHGSSFQLEMAQEGFSALLTPEGAVLGAVGAYDWSGGVFLYGDAAEPTFVNVSQAATDMSDAYLGYAVESLTLGGARGFVLGAPRYQHVGKVMVILRGASGVWELVADASGQQVGSYFGAALCALDLSGDGSTDAVLVGAPMYYGAASGGRVSVCAVGRQGGQLRCQRTLWGEPGHPLGRFGASLARLGDVNGDGRADVAVGAPLEDDERGAVYVFLGERGGLSPHYSQRVAGARFPSGPRHFGQAVSGGADLTGDRLPDVAVGARGQVLLLRSRPLLGLGVSIAFQPGAIPTTAFDCQEQDALGTRVSDARVCFNLTKMTKDNLGDAITSVIHYQLALDPGRLKVRATFSSRSSSHNESLRMKVTQLCKVYSIVLPVCPEDTLTPITLRLTYTVTGDPIGSAGGLAPALSSGSPQPVLGQLFFEKDCGTDNRCVDELHVSLSFSGLLTVVVGVTPEVDVTVTLRNTGEDSYGTTVRLRHPPALSYRKVVVLQSNRRVTSVHCGAAGDAGTDTLCSVNHPIFRAGAEVVFVATLDVPPDAKLGDTLEIAATAGSDNGNVATPGGSHRAQISVRYGVFLVLTSLEDSTKYLNISAKSVGAATAGITHCYQVTSLRQRRVPVAVTFAVPAALGEAPAWQDARVVPSQPELVQCRSARQPGAADAAPRLRQRPVLDCAVAACTEIRCEISALEPGRPLGLNLTGSLAFAWMAQVQHPKVTLQSVAQLQYDEGRYHNTGGAPRHQVQTEVERREPPNPLPLVLGGSAAGLALLGLAVLALYKLGFFKRHYKELMEGDDAAAAATGPAEPQG
ncbi:integrin alpha-X-like [Rhea pennata]|uniref:integrin alpha-X-like n=1 Tax=Rhea pennata TaxID=8795 RepID=UPI002E260F80